jgi:glycosyltransferase involved in cell wall biosynthesis
MKVALVHDWLVGMRGGERLFERICLQFPGAPVYTLVWKPGGVSAAIEAHSIYPSFVQRLPDATRRYRWYLPLFPRAIEGFDLSEFDVIVSSSHCVAKSVRTRPGQFHLSYIHTPMRYIYELEPVYFPPGKFPWPLSAYVRHTVAGLRSWDRTTSDRPTAMVCNSEHVAERIRRHYGREAEVIYPPVDVARFATVPPRPQGTRAGDVIGRPFYLLAGAFAPYKRGELAIEACVKLGRRVIVVGTGQEERTLRAAAGPAVEFIGWASDGHLAELYRRAEALIFPGEEDFGMVPVEAMASGCPVIAYGRGGALETIGRGADAETLTRVAHGGVARVPGGVLFGTQSVEGVVGAIQALEANPVDREALPKQARPFSEDRFDREFRAAFDRHYADFGRARQSPAGTRSRA